MLAVEGTYCDGKIELLETIKSRNATKVIVTFLNEEVAKPTQKLTEDKFNFRKTRELLKDVEINFADSVIEERRVDL